MPSGEPEIFRSIQGEGVNTGASAVFLRLATCNLACTWCDTKYTWDFRHHDYDTEVMELSQEAVQERVLGWDCPHLIITGGEPMLQQQELAPVVASLRRRRFFCEVETNGTIAPEPEMAGLVSQWNVSPKTSSSGNRRDGREVPAALASFREVKTAYFKFVIVEPEDVEEVRRLVDTYDLPGDRVVLMPEGVTPDTIRDRGRWVAEACARHGFRFSTRLHIMLWGDQRGR